MYKRVYTLQWRHMNVRLSQSPVIRQWRYKFDTIRSILGPETDNIHTNWVFLRFCDIVRCPVMACPTKHISIEFQIRWKFKTL